MDCRHQAEQYPGELWDWNTPILRHSVSRCGGTVPADSEFAREGLPTGTSLFRASEAHLGISWNTAAEI